MIIEIWQKCKGSWFTGLILILVALGSFGLGRLTKIKALKSPIRVESAVIEPTESAAVNLSFGQTDQDGQVVGSRQGNKYHFPWCAGAKRIKPENLIKFTSVEAAKQAGYEPAGNCPGL